MKISKTVGTYKIARAVDRNKIDFKGGLKRGMFVLCDSYHPTNTYRRLRDLFGKRFSDPHPGGAFRANPPGP